MALNFVTASEAQKIANTSEKKGAKDKHSPFFAEVLTLIPELLKGGKTVHLSLLDQSIGQKKDGTPLKAASLKTTYSVKISEAVKNDASLKGKVRVIVRPLIEGETDTVDADGNAAFLVIN